MELLAQNRERKAARLDPPGSEGTDTELNETVAMIMMRITKRLDEKRIVSRHKTAFFCLTVPFK